MPRLADLTGRRSGLLMVERRAGNSGAVKWFCRCDCGETSSVRSADLIRGRTKSCGCLQRTAAAKMGRGNTIHGKRRSPEYRAWASMIYRCENPRHPKFEYWGGRGICVCQEWRASFEAFLEHMGERPTPSHSIDRDNDGNYEPGNCRWATKREQVLNRRPQRMCALTDDQIKEAAQ